MLTPDFNELVQLAGKSARLRMKTRRKMDSKRAGDYASAFRGQGLEFHEVREYRLGDDVRNIDWRVTARMEKPYLKVFTEERERTVLLCVDAGAAMRFGTRKTFKSIQAARTAALLGWMAQGAGDKVGATVFGDVPKGLQFFAPVRGRRALWQTLKLLSRKPEAADAKGVALEDALVVLNRTAPTGALVFVVSDFARLPDVVEMHLANLRRRCDVILVRIDDPADRNLPPMDAVWFSDAKNRILAATGSKSGRDAYARQWDDNRRRLQNIAARQRIGIVDLHTHTDLLADLTHGLRLIDLQRRSKS